MALDIVYGYQGKDHVKASQLARLLSGTIGEGRYVLGTQNEMAASMQTANKVRISTGDLVMDGRYITNEAYQDLTVDSGQSGYNRNDLVGVQYSRASGSDADHAVETVSLVVKKGTQTTGAATDPSYTAGDISAGDASAFYPLWRLPISGLTVGDPVQLFEKAPSVADLRETISQIQSDVTAASTVQEYTVTSSSSYVAVDFCYRIGKIVFLKGHFACWSEGFFEANLTGLPGPANYRAGLTPDRYDSGHWPFWTAEITGTTIRCYMQESTAGSGVYWYWSCVYLLVE